MPRAVWVKEIPPRQYNGGAKRGRPVDARWDRMKARPGVWLLWGNYPPSKGGHYRNHWSIIHGKSGHKGFEGATRLQKNGTVNVYVRYVGE